MSFDAALSYSLVHSMLLPCHVLSCIPYYYPVIFSCAFHVTTLSCSLVHSILLPCHILLCIPCYYPVMFSRAFHITTLSYSLVHSMLLPCHVLSCIPYYYPVMFPHAFHIVTQRNGTEFHRFSNLGTCSSFKRCFPPIHYHRRRLLRWQPGHVPLTMEKRLSSVITTLCSPIFRFASEMFLTNLPQCSLFLIGFQTLG